MNVPWSIEYKSWWIKIYHILQYTNGSIHLLYRVRDIGPCEPLVFILTLFTLDRIICLLCLYICHYIFPFYYLDIFFIFFLWTHWDRKHYYIKVVESIQFVCAGNSGISLVLCNANTYRSIHEGLFFNSSPALDLKYPLRLPYIHFYFSSHHLQYKIYGIHS